MDSELRTVIYRYVTVGIAISVAAIWTVFYAQDADHPNGAPLVVGADAGPAAEDTEGLAPPAPGKAPSLREMFVERDGVLRVQCAPACRLEAYCSLRTVDACLQSSCAGDLRIEEKGDLDFARADDCTAAAEAPCADACHRRATCGGDADEAACVEKCRSRAKLLATESYRRSRCVIEAKQCSDVAACPAP